MYHDVIANNGQNKACYAFSYELVVQSCDTKSEEAVVFVITFLGSL
jgi:hypothetical protein